MKYLYLSLLALIISFSDSFGQEFQYSETVLIENVSKGNLYQRAIEWVNANFKSSKDVIQVNDKEAGNIFMKGVIKLDLPADDYIYFSFNILLKDGKYKYIIKDLYHEGSTEGGPRNGGNLQNEKPDCGGGRMTGRYWQKIKTASDNKMKSLVASLKTKMANVSDAEDF